ISIPTNLQTATVNGLVTDNERRISGATVKISYPSAGALTSTSVASDANGYFTFAGIPLGVRAVSITSAPTMSPKQIIVDKSNYTIPSSILNYFGTTQAVSYTAGSAVSLNSGKNAQATLSSNYEANLQVSSITVSCGTCGGTQVSGFILNDVAQTFA